MGRSSHQLRDRKARVVAPLQSLQARRLSRGFPITQDPSFTGWQNMLGSLMGVAVNQHAAFMLREPSLGQGVVHIHPSGLLGFAGFALLAQSTRHAQALGQGLL